jgi:hypothetical protein
MSFNKKGGAITPIPSRQLQSRMRSSEPSYMKLSIDQLSNFSSNENIVSNDWPTLVFNIISYIETFGQALRPNSTADTVIQ